MKYIPSFGIEIHVELLTNTKAFSAAKVDFTLDKPNSNVNETDLGFPGAKPSVNKKVVEHAYRLAKALNMKIEEVLYFDRKNYFYPDLAKGFQITQFFKPIGTNGYLEVYDKENKVNKIDITDIHIEEDTAKQNTTSDGKVTFDFNRAGVGLIEIVSGHKNLHSIEDVINYVEQIRELVVFLEICDGKLEEGSFRVDVNVSIRKTLNDPYGQRVEIKNLNSFNFIKKALEFEIDLQEKTIEAGNKVEMTTKRYDEKSNKTIVMRKKSSENEYNFFAETNINPIKLTSEMKTEFEKVVNIYPFQIRKEYSNILTQDNLNQLLNNKNVALCFIGLVKQNRDPKEIYNFLIQFLTPLLAKFNVANIKDKFNDETLIKLEGFLKENKITKKDLSEKLEKYFNNELSLDVIIKEVESVKQITEEEILELIKQIFNNNPALKDEREERINKFVPGELMKLTKGKVNMKLASIVLSKFLGNK